jgi:hypothetical protein
MTLPPVEFEQYLWDVTAMLKAVKEFPTLLVKSEIKGILPDLMKGDFFVGRGVELVSGSRYEPTQNTYKAIYTEGIPPFSTTLLADLYLKITASGTWEIMKIRAPDNKYLFL